MTPTFTAPAIKEHARVQQLPLLDQPPATVFRVVLNANLGERAIYLLHFGKAYKHARHYLGSTDDLEQRMVMHLTGRGARLMEVIVGAGITFELARTWVGDRKLERRLKNLKGLTKVCPICFGGRALRNGNFGRLGRHARVAERFPI